MDCSDGCYSGFLLHRQRCPFLVHGPSCGLFERHPLAMPPCRDRPLQPSPNALRLEQWYPNRHSLLMINPLTTTVQGIDNNSNKQTNKQTTQASLNSGGMHSTTFLWPPQNSLGCVVFVEFGRVFSTSRATISAIEALAARFMPNRAVGRLLPP